jgi:glutamine synthetase
VSALDAWRAFHTRHPDTTTVDILIPDLSGIARGKRLSAGGLEAALGHGLLMSTSVYAVDVTGANVDASGLVWEEGDADRPLLPDAATFAPVPWRAGTAQVIAGLADHDGSPFFADPRRVLAQVAGRLGALGLRPVAALELEFYLVQPTCDSAGSPLPLRHPSGRAAAEGQVYAFERLDAQDAVLQALDAYAAAQGLPVQAAIAEYAPGQFELTLGHVGDMVRAADHAWLLKRAVRAAARAAGIEATFMAKPFPRLSGNGLHVHVSLLDSAGANVFAGPDGERLLGHAVAGLQATMAEAMLVFAPGANSYRRFRPMSYAPTAPTWGVNNRTVAIRIPAGPEAARRVEHRVAGADANPYLALAAVLAGIHHGITGGLEPGPQTTGNAYAKVAPSLPVSWEASLAAFDAGAILPGLLGERFCRLFRAVRAAERDRFDDHVTPLEYAWYLHTA